MRVVCTFGLALALPFALAPLGCGADSESALGPGHGGSGGGSDVGGADESAAGCSDDGSGWSSSWQAFECEVLELTNQRRAQGAVCGGVRMGSVGPVSRHPELTTSARGHALDMGERNYFEHASLDGRSPFDRMQQAGFLGARMGENVAAGQRTPLDVVNGWMTSPPHCKNVMTGAYRYLGVGYSYAPESTYRHLWVQNFGG